VFRSDSGSSSPAADCGLGVSSPMHNVTRAHLVRSESPGDGDQDLDSVEEDDDDDDEQERSTTSIATSPWHGRSARP
jgi:hypothetical protein